MSGNIISQPDISIAVIPAAQTISNEPQRVLFIGQQTAAATAITGALQTNIGNDSSENGLFGIDSMLAGMIRAAKIINGVTRMDAIGLDDAGAGTEATATVIFATTAGVAGLINVTIGSDRNHSYDLPVAVLDDPTAIGDLLVAAIAADTKAPFSAVNAIGTVTITFGHKGTVGNFVSITTDVTDTDMTSALTAFVGGATDPTLTGLFDVIDGERYQTIIWPSEYGYTPVTDLLDARFNATNDILDGVAIAASVDSLANLKIEGNAENSLSLVVLGNRTLTDADAKAGSMVEFDYAIASELGAVRALRLTQDASISRYVIATSGARDAFGGPAISALPYFNTPFFELPIVAPDKGFTAVEVEELGDASISVLGNNRARNTVIAGEIVTTRKTDSAGNPEDTFKYLNNVDTSSNVREFMFNNLKARYAQSRLTEGDLVPRRNMANADSIAAFLDGMYQTLSGEEYVLTQAGEVALKFFQANRSVTIDLLNGKVTVTMQVPIVVQLRTIIATMQIAFSTEA